MSVSIKRLPQIAGKDAFLKITYDILPRVCLKNKNCTKRMFYFPFL